MSDTNNEVRAPEEKRLSQGNAKRLSQGNAVPEGEPQASSVPRRSQGSTGGQARISIGGGEQRRASDVPNEDQRRASANPPADQLGAPAVPGDQPRGSITGDQPRLSLGADQPRLSVGAAGARGSVGQEGKRMSQTGQRLSQGGAMGELQQPRLSGAGQQRLSQGFSPGEDGLRRSQGANLEEQLQPEAEGIVGASLGNPLNERTYQEVEYLKRSLGPILVAALAEICIRRPSDPIEYLGHWLLRWRYNEELKRRDVQNALEVVRKKTWADEQGLPDPNAPAIPPGPESFGAGFVPQHPYGPPGYGGPLGTDQVLNALAEDMPPVEEEEEMEETSEFLDVNEGLNMAPSVDRVPEIQPSLLAQASAAAIRTSLKKEGSAAVLAEGEKRASMGGEKRTSVGGEKRASMGGEKRASMGGEKRTSVGEKRASLKAEGSTVIQEKRASLGAEGGEKRTSIEGAPRKSLEEKRPSLKAEDKPPSGEEKRPSLSEKRPSLKSEAPGDAPTEVPPPAE